MSTAPKTTSGQSWGILNPWGDFWTHNTFETKEAARRYLERFWERGVPQNANLGDYSFIRVQVMLTALPVDGVDNGEGGGPCPS